MGTVVVGRLAVLLDAQTSLFESRLDAAAQVSDKFTRTQAVAARAVGQVRSGLQGLANQAFATAGPLGQVASGLTQIVGGASALAGAAVGGAIFLWFDHLTKQLDEATKKSQELHATWRRMAAERIGSPLLGLMAEREPLENQRDLLKSQIADRVASTRFDVMEGEDRTLAAVLRDDVTLQQWFSQLQAINGIIGEIERKPEAMLLPLQRQLATLGRPIEEAAQLQARWAGLTGETADEFVALQVIIHAIADDLRRAAQTQGQIEARLGQFRVRALSEGTPPEMRGVAMPTVMPLDVLQKDQSLRTGIFMELLERESQYQAVLKLSSDATFQAQLAAAGLTERFEHLIQSMNRTEIKSQQLTIAIVTSVSSAIQAIIGEGGIGSFVSGAGGVLSALATKNPSLLIPGVVLGAFGGILGAFERQHSERERNEERRKNELIAAIHEGPLRVSNEYLGDRESSVYEDRRLERLGGEPRLGGV